MNDSPHRVFLSLGSNLGDRRTTLKEALERLGRSSSVRAIRQSSLYETVPVGKTDQPQFLNLVAEVETTLSPEGLLDITQAIERELGRTRDVRWGPRTLDIDILLYDSVSMNTTRLTVPHLEMTQRRFVLEPLLEIAPDAVLPDGRPVRSFLSDVSSQEVRRLSA